MQPKKAAPRPGPPTLRLPAVAVRPDVDRLRAVWVRRAALVQTLVVAVSGGTTARRGKAARRAVGGRGEGRARALASARVDAGDTLEVSLPLDGGGPREARAVVERLRGRIAPSVLEDAQLVVSELVTNAVRHSGVPDGGVVVLRVELTGTMVRLEVTDPGSGAVIAPRAPDLERGGGFGLHVVRALSERWGLEQVAAGGTRVWAQLPRVPPAAPASAQSGDVAGEGSRNGDRATGERKPSAGVRVPEQPGRAVR
jgi:anti-sigma regulatory factor (Ser/Thr protein kinase)